MTISKTSDVAERSKETLQRIISRRRIIALTVFVCGASFTLVLTLEPRLIALGGAFAIGWSHLAGRCGLSHFGALTPQAKVPGRRSRWAADVLVYVVAGAIASTAVGASLATVGELMPQNFRLAAMAMVLVFAAVAAASELRLIQWRLPEPRFQTRREWGMFRPPIPAALWGFGLGLTFATVFTFSGTWLVLTFPLVLGEPAFGATLLLAHWLGRSTPILTGPVLLRSSGHTLELLEDIENSYRLFRGSNVVGIGLIALSIVILLGQ